MSDDLAVIIVSYNVRQFLRNCLRSLLASLAQGGLGSYQVVVVDNGSVDGSPDLVAREFPNVQLLALDENRGFAAANNVGLREVTARYVLLLNPDTEVLGEAPAALVRFLETHPRVGLCGGRLLNSDLTFQHSAFRFPTLLMSLIDFFPLNHRLVNSRLNGRYPRQWYARPFAIDHPLGACMLVRQEVVQRVGLFDEGYFMYCEEVDWCYRIKQAGCEVFYTPTGEIVHHIGASTRQVTGPMLVQLHRSRDRFFRRHYGPVFALVASQVVRLGMAAAATRARREARRGLMDRVELERRLLLYDAVGR